MSTTIEDRVILILIENGEPYGYWTALEKQTRISSKRWRKVTDRQQRVTSDMIEAIAKKYPKYAFWIATGITDAINGHIAPINALTFPERLYTEQIWTREYFRLSIDLAEELGEAGGIDLNDDETRFKAFERARVFTNYHGSGLVNIAYKISKTEKYRNLNEVIEEREKERLTIRSKSLDKDKKNIDKKDGVMQENILGASDKRTEHQSNDELLWRAID